MSTMILSDLTKMKTGDLIDAIHDVVCGMGSDGPIPKSEYDELFSLVDELRSRSVQASATNKKSH